MGLFSSEGANGLVGTSLLVFAIGAWAIWEYRGRELRHARAMQGLKSHNEPAGLPRTNWARVAATAVVFIALATITVLALDFNVGKGDLFSSSLAFLKYSVLSGFVIVALLLLAMVIRDIKILTKR